MCVAEQTGRTRAPGGRARGALEAQGRPIPLEDKRSEPDDAGQNATTRRR